MLPPVEVIAHADWGSQPDKRWLASARLGLDGYYHASDLRSVPDPSSLLKDLQAMADRGGPVLAGFDFPIGLPAAYAKKAGVQSFLSLLPRLGQGEWADFYHPASLPEEIHLHRPFYPLRAGQAHQAHLLHALGVDTLSSLRRFCEQATPARRAAAPLFWTLGGQQVGKAAIIGWKDTLVPALCDKASPLAIWPFSGDLPGLLQPGSLVAAECYPAEYYAPLQIRFPARQKGKQTGKRSVNGRLANAAALQAASRAAGLVLSPSLADDVRSGFGAYITGEDRFDALIGLLGILYALRGFLPATYPSRADVREMEGWILGQKEPE